MSNDIIKSGTGRIEKTGTGRIERTGTGSIERTGTGSIERTGTGAIFRAGLFLCALLLSSGVIAETFTIGGLMVTTTDHQAVVTWHRVEAGQVTLLSGAAKLENGYALIDLSGSDATKAGAVWGQLDLQIDADGVSGTIVPFDAASQFIFEASDAATYVLPVDAASLMKVAGNGTGGSNDG